VTAAALHHPGSAAPPLSHARTRPKPHRLPTIASEVIHMAKLAAKSRRRMKPSSFAIPSKKAYPIHDRSHARNALARVAQHGTAADKAKVRRAVKRKYPSIGKS
jgi:hypothetical protein